MRKALLSTIFLCFCISVFGQINIKHNLIRPGDEIVKQQIEYKDPGRSGKNVVWNFSKLKAVNPEYKLTYSAPRAYRDSIYIIGKDTIPLTDISEGDLVIGKEHYTRYYYRIKNDTLLCLGHQNALNSIWHTDPYLMLTYPFDYGQKIGKDCRTEGLYSSKEHIKTRGSISVECDAYGMMVLPSGDTLSHVLRIKTLQAIHEADSIRLTEENPLNMEIETYRWYVKGYRYPVFEAMRSFEVSDTARNETFNTAFFYPPQEHYYLADDPENLAVIDSLWNEKQKTPTNPTNPNGNMSQSDGFNYNFYPNPVKDNLHIEYMLEEAADIAVTLYDMKGMAIQSLPKKSLPQGLYSEKIDCSNLPQGNYILRLKVNDEIVNHKIVKE